MSFYNYIRVDKNLIFYYVWNKKGEIIRTSFNPKIIKNNVKDNNRKIHKIFEDYFINKIPIDKQEFVFDAGLTEFEKSVLLMTKRIPFGKTITYGELAKKIGRDKSYRAVGNALGKNPLPVLIPCHRVLAKSGLGGFTGGLHIKKYLLSLEGIKYS